MGAVMDVDKTERGLRADLARARSQADPDAERAVRKRLAALGIAEAARARQAAAEEPSDGERNERRQPPKDRRVPQHRTTAKRTSPKGQT